MPKRPEKGREAVAGAPRRDEPPFSRPFAVDELLRRPDEPITVSADADELAALARSIGIPGIGELKAEFKVNKQGKEIRVTGDVRAHVAQECVVTLEPFESVIEEPVDVRFAFAPPPAPPEPAPGERMSRRRAAQARQEPRAAAPEFASHDEDDPPDPIVDGKIDLGALAAEFMALGLDPYPRKPGAVFEAAPDDDEAGESPFARLARLKKDT